MSATQSAEARLQVGVATTESERQEIFRLRYQVYVEEMGLQPSEADHQRRLIRDDWDESAILLYVKHGNELVGTLRRNVLSRVPIPASIREGLKLDVFLADFSADRMSISTKFIVAPQWRSSAVAGMLIEHGYLLGRKNGYQFDFNHCAPALISLYEQVGFRRYTRNIEHPDVGIQVPMVMVVDDREYFQRCKCLVSRLARDFEYDPEPARWFARTFPQHAVFISPRTLSREMFWQTLSQILHRPPTESVPLFRRLSDEETQRFLRLAAVHRYQEGETILRQGDAGEEMFVVLSGTVEAICTVNGEEYSLRKMGAGEVFGEMALFMEGTRTARVVALTDTEVLVLTRHILQAAMTGLPEIAAKVMFNLVATLCNRLHDRSNALGGLPGGSEQDGPDR